MVLSEPEGLLRIAIADQEGAWGFWLQQAVEKARKVCYLQLGGDPPLTHDLRRLLLLLAQLTVDAVQLRNDADPTPLGLDRKHFNRQGKELLARVNALIVRGSHADP